MEMIKDALGRDLHLGDQVVYCHRQGSNMRLEQREVTTINYKDNFLHLNHGTGRVNPSNCARLSNEED